MTGLEIVRTRPWRAPLIGWDPPPLPGRAPCGPLRARRHLDPIRRRRGHRARAHRGFRASAGARASRLDRGDEASERGPFSRIRWFCKDGALLPPRRAPASPTAGAGSTVSGAPRRPRFGPRATSSRTCWRVSTRPRGGGARVSRRPSPRSWWSGSWWARTTAGSSGAPSSTAGPCRRGRARRGAAAPPRDARGARVGGLPLSGAARRRPPAPPREGHRLDPEGPRGAATLADLDPGFVRLRAKIHGTPEAQDAASVREHAARSKRPTSTAQYEELAAQIERVYAGPPLAERLEQEAAVMTRAPWLQQSCARPRGPGARRPRRRRATSPARPCSSRLRDALPAGQRSPPPGCASST